VEAERILGSGESRPLSAAQNFGAGVTKSVILKGKKQQFLGLAPIGLREGFDKVPYLQQVTGIRQKPGKWHDVCSIETRYPVHCG
jgi:hypothetical protein